MYDYPDELGKLSPDFLWSMVNININSVTMMTRMLVNDMKKRGKGAIVNLSSGSELQPLPYAAVYGASKVSVIFDTINTYIARVIHSIIPAFGLDLREEFYISNAAWVGTVWHYGAIDYTALCAHQNESLLDNSNTRKYFLSRCGNIHTLSRCYSRKNKWNYRLLDTWPSGLWLFHNQWANYSTYSLFDFSLSSLL